MMLAKQSDGTWGVQFVNKDQTMCLTLLEDEEVPK